MVVAQLDRGLGAVDAVLIQLGFIPLLVPRGARAIGQHGNAVAIIELQIGNGRMDVRLVRGAEETQSPPVSNSAPCRRRIISGRFVPPPRSNLTIAESGLLLPSACFVGVMGRNLA